MEDRTFKVVLGDSFSQNFDTRKQFYSINSISISFNNILYLFYIYFFIFIKNQYMIITPLEKGRYCHKQRATTRLERGST